MNNKGFIARIPKDISDFVIQLQSDREWTLAQTLRKLITTSSIYLEYQAKEK